MGSPIVGLINLPNTVTLSGLMLSLLAAALSVLGNFYGAILCVMWAGIADLFDGFVARRTVRTPLESSVGKHLDSLCDVCSFGFAPAVFAYAFGLREPWFVAILLFYVCANALRLAYFDAIGMAAEGERQFFTGMPVTYAALFIPVAFALSFWFDRAEMAAVLGALYFCLGAAMVSGKKIPKPRGIWYGVFSLLALGLTAVYGWALLHGWAPCAR